MDLLSGESPQILSKSKRRFRSLKLVSVNDDDVLPETPYGVDYGRLSNGLTYYVRSNSKPKMRAALALAVKVGSVLEEEEERGVAHIVEHLAFSATKKYTNHDIVKFLESIGAEFGACQNAVTSADETVYELFVPVDKPELLSQSISVLAEFSSEVRVSASDLEKERGAVLEEFRGSRNANGRMQDAHWVLMMEGSKYAERLPIGLEKVIRTVTPETVKRFYNKWYHMQNMALIAVGDFPDTQSVVELIKTHFEDKTLALDPPLIPQFTVPSHEEPRYSSFVESEAAGSAVMVSCNVPMVELKTVKDYRNLLAESMFFHALNQRFFKLSRKNNPPYFSCSAAADVLVSTVKAYIMTSSCKQNGTTEALESMLIEVVRVHVHGFSEREISVARAFLMSEIESAYLERDQMQSSNLRDDYIQHFLRNEPVVGIEYEAQLHKTLLPYISASEVSKYSENFRNSLSCVIKTIEPQAAATVDDLKNVVLRVNSLEEGSIGLWDDEKIPEEIVSVEPNPGHVLQQLEYSCIGATEMILSNGIRVCYKCTDFFDDQLEQSWAACIQLGKIMTGRGSTEHAMHMSKEHILVGWNSPGWQHPGRHETRSASTRPEGAQLSTQCTCRKSMFWSAGTVLGGHIQVVKYTTGSGSTVHAMHVSEEHVLVGWNASSEDSFELRVLAEPCETRAYAVITCSGRRGPCWSASQRTRSVLDATVEDVSGPTVEVAYSRGCQRHSNQGGAAAEDVKL
ncbi:probable zinc protease pqql [Phtheirospermum japonicum]|uniref:Probable zinc protease pqql n=1 Tax=Phtheirospermum japonicum TaxID=374723 RepID=A0A830BBE2_9LAMI|nr:probable zinc protease pqql [Phtheirospermum japonicum]